MERSQPTMDRTRFSDSALTTTTAMAEIANVSDVDTAYDSKLGG